MTRSLIWWLFAPAARRERRARRRSRRPNAIGLAPYTRCTRFESVEERLLLTHTAPMLNPADTPTFAAVAENTPIASNAGERVVAMLETGGPIVSSPPLGSNFAFYDLNNGALEGIAITGVTGDDHGMWEYQLQTGGPWVPLTPGITPADAVALEPNDLIRFLPDEGFSGSVSLQFVAWDHTDSLADGGRVDLTLPDVTGGATAYSTASTTATLAVTAAVTPSFSLTSTSTLEDNTVAASGGVPGGSNPNVITVPNFASGIEVGDGGGNSVTFSVSDNGGNFGTLFAQPPQIDSQGTLTYQLKPDVYGTALLSVTATNGALTSTARSATITVTQINDPPTLSAIANPAWVQDTAGQQTIALSGITDGYDETGQVLSVTAAATPQGSDDPSLIYNLGINYTNPDSTGTVYYTPSPGHEGTLHVTVTVNDGGGTANGGVQTFSQTFVVTVYTVPSFYIVQPTFGAPNYAPATIGVAEDINTGTPNAGDSLSFVGSSDSAPQLFSVAPAMTSAGTLTFTPAAGAMGQATLGFYLVNNSDGLASATHTFTVDVVAPPTGNPDTYVVNASGGSIASTSQQSVLINDSDPNANPQLNAVLTAQASYASVTFGTDGSFQYYPNSGFQGVDRFSYQPYDAAGPAYGNTVTVTLYSHGGALVTKIYQQMVKHGAYDSEITSWAPGIDNGSSNMGNVDQGIYNSDEYLQPQITTFYQNFLGATPDPNGMSYWETMWRQYESPEQVIIGIASTSACYSFSGGTNTSWVTLLYEKILARQPDQSGLNYFVGELNGGASRQQVAQQFVTTSEYRGDVIQNFFQMFLYRSAGSSEVSYYQGLFNSGYTQLQIQSVIVNSSEYYGNPPAAAAESVYKWG